MADQKGSALGLRGTPDRANDYLYVWNGTTPYRSTINNELGITGTPVGTTDSQTLTNKTLTAPTITAPVLSGTITGTYTLGGTPTFPSTVVTLTGSQTLTNKILTSPTLTAPTLTNASITADAISGFTSANTGTIYGVPVTSGAISGSALTNATVTASKLNLGPQGASVATSETTTSTAYTDLTTTTDTVTVTIGANGLAWVAITCNAANATNGGYVYMSFAVSGTSTVAAGTYQAEAQEPGGSASSFYPLSGMYLVTGLTAGSCTFKLKYKVSTGTGSFLERRIAVMPV